MAVQILSKHPSCLMPTQFTIFDHLGSANCIPGCLSIPLVSKIKNDADLILLILLEVLLN